MTAVGRTTILGILLLVAATAASLAATAKVYYVSPGGDNANSGLTINKPFRSINVAIKKASAGDTIYILPGTYRELIVLSAKKGVPEKPICLVGLSAEVGNYPIIDGGALKPSSTASFDWINLTDCEWIEVARLKFRNGWTFPIKVIRSSYLTFRNCQFWGGKRVINATTPTTHHILVEDCFWDQGGEFLWRVESDTEGVAAWTSMHHGAMAYFNGSLIDFHGTGGSMVVRRNTVVNAFQAVRYRGEKGFDSNVEIYENHVSNMRDNDFEPEYYTYNLHIYHNVSHNIHKTLSVDNVEGGQIYYYGNVVTADTDLWSATICDGIWKVYGRPNFLSYPIYAFNNSFWSPGIAFHTMNGKATLLKHINNAYFFLKEGGWELSQWDATNEFDYDISNKAWPPNLRSNNQEAHGIIGEVKYVDPGHGNLRLLPGSAGIDAGKTLSLKEFEWTQSFRGKAPDMGAYEDGILVEGPPFRYMESPDGKSLYQEKPRIVRHHVIGNRVIIYFSDQIDPAASTKGDVAVFEGERVLNISSLSFPRNKYEMVIETGAVSDPSALSVAFKQLPRGMNGEQATVWASTIRIHENMSTSK
jgi:hypothetical protein